MSRIYYLNVKSFNKSIDVSKLLLGLDTNWECCVHSYYIVINGERQKVLRKNCNLVEFDRVSSHICLKSYRIERGYPL